MINVKIKCELINKRVVFTNFIVDGHANDGSYNALKVCASVTAMVQVIPEMLSDKDKSLCQFSKGHFAFKLKEYDVIDMFIQDALLVIFWQLAYVQKQYPKFFKFDVSGGN